MKKRVIVSILMILFITSALFTLEGKILEVEGVAEAIKGARTKAITIDDSIASGVTIATGFNSKVLLKINDSTILIKSLTQVTIETIDDSEENLDAEIYLERGFLQTDIYPSSSKTTRLTIKTANATAQLTRGSGGLNSSGTITGISGTWQYKSQKGKKTIVKKGDVVSVNQKGLIQLSPQYAETLEKTQKIKSLAEEEKIERKIMRFTDTEKISSTQNDESPKTSISINLTGI